VSSPHAGLADERVANRDDVPSEEVFTIFEDLVGSAVAASTCRHESIEPIASSHAGNRRNCQVREPPSPGGVRADKAIVVTARRLVPVQVASRSRARRRRYVSCASWQSRKVTRKSRAAVVSPPTRSRSLMRSCCARTCPSSNLSCASVFAISRLSHSRRARAEPSRLSRRTRFVAAILKRTLQSTRSNLLSGLIYSSPSKQIKLSRFLA
jgi:hypothetical protein